MKGFTAFLFSTLGIWRTRGMKTLEALQTDLKQLRKLEIMNTAAYLPLSVCNDNCYYAVQ